MRAPQREGDDDYLQKEEITAILIEKHKALQKANQDLSIKLEKQRINAESELNIEKKHHEKTILELNKTKGENRELKKDIQNLESKLQRKDQEINDLKARLESRAAMNREMTELQEQLRDREEDIISLKKDYGQTYEQLSKEVINRVSLLENENKSLTKDNQALREGFERLESERNILKVETLELTKKIGGLKSKRHAMDLSTPNKFEKQQQGNNGSPQTNTLKATKSLTTSKKMPEDKYNERDERLSMPRESADLSYMGASESRRIIAEVIEVFNLRTPADIVPSIRKTEKVMQAIPKLQRLLGEIAGIVFSRSQGSSGENHIETIVPHLKTWVNHLDEWENLKEFRLKLVEKLGLRKDSDYVTILKTIDDIMYLSFQHEEMRLKSQKEANENVEHKLIINQLTSLLGTEPTVGMVKHMMVQRKDLGHFIDLMKTQLNLDPEMSHEACFTHLLKFITTARKDRQAGHVLNRLQEVLACSIDNVLPTVEEYK